MILCSIYELREENDCHNPAGSGGGQFCGPGYLSGEAERAGRLGVQLKVNPSVPARDSVYHARRGQIEVGTKGSRRANILTITRHEVGHVTDPMTSVRPAQLRVGGLRVNPNYAREFGAWKAAVRDSQGRLRWSAVHHALSNYLATDDRVVEKVQAQLWKRGISRADATWTAAAAQEYSRIAGQHVALLKRYARRARAKS